MVEFKRASADAVTPTARTAAFVGSLLLKKLRFAPVAVPFGKTAKLVPAFVTLF